MEWNEQEMPPLAVLIHGLMKGMFCSMKWNEVEWNEQETTPLAALVHDVMESMGKAGMKSMQWIGREPTCSASGLAARSVTLEIMRSMGSSTSVRLSRARNQLKDARMRMMKMLRAMLSTACTTALH
jgi:hypothetical protein